MPDLYRTCCQKASDLCCLEDNKGKAMYWEGNNFLLPCILFTIAPKTPIGAPYDSFFFWRLEGQCLPDGYIQLVLLSHYFLHSIIILVVTVFAPTVLSQFRPSPFFQCFPYPLGKLGFWVVFIWTWNLDSGLSPAGYPRWRHLNDEVMNSSLLE